MELEGIIRAFEEASGVTMHRWEPHNKIGAAVKLINSGGAGKIKEELESLQAAAEKIANNTKKVLAQLELQSILPTLP